MTTHVITLWHIHVDVYRSVGDFPEQQCSPRPDPEMSGGLPGVQESHFPKVSKSDFLYLPPALDN